jgi:hypothetical protein
MPIGGAAGPGPPRRPGARDRHGPGRVRGKAPMRSSWAGDVRRPHFRGLIAPAVPRRSVGGVPRPPIGDRLPGRRHGAGWPGSGSDPRGPQSESVIALGPSGPARTLATADDGPRIKTDPRCDRRADGPYETTEGSWRARVGDQAGPIRSDPLRLLHQGYCSFMPRPCRPRESLPRPPGTGSSPETGSEGESRSHPPGERCPQTWSIIRSEEIGR